MMSLLFRGKGDTFLIYGAGAVGLGVASCLLKAGQQVTILARPSTAEILRQAGLKRTGLFGDVWAPAGSFDVASSLDELSGQSFDYVLVCTKSFDSERVAREVYANTSCLTEQGCLVLFQNGWGNADVFAHFFPRELVYSARVITGFVRLDKNYVDVTVHADAIHVGSLFSDNVERIAPLCEAIAAGDIPCRAVREIARDLWAKLLFNCPLNSLGAIFGVPYGNLGQSRPLCKIMDTIIQEIFDVMWAAGYSTHWTSPEEYLVKFYGDLIPLTARHHSSTLQDLRARKRTEIDALNGAIVALGKKHHLAVPANEIVYNMIKFLEGCP